MLNFKQVFNTDPWAYLRRWFASEHGIFVKNYTVLNETEDFQEFHIEFHGKTQPNQTLLLDDEMYEKIVKSYGANPPDGVSKLMSFLNVEREAHMVTQKEFSSIYSVKTLIKIIDKLKKVNFDATTKKEAYEVISKLFTEKVFVYSPISKEIYTSNEPPYNKRIRLLYTIGSQWTDSGKAFDEELYSVLNEFIKNTNLEKAEHISNYFKEDFYRIDYNELVKYCNLFAIKRTPKEEFIASEETYDE